MVAKNSNSFTQSLKNIYGTNNSTGVLANISPNNLPSKIECGREQHGDCDEHNSAAAVVPTQDTFGKPSH